MRRRNAQGHPWNNATGCRFGCPGKRARDKLCCRRCWTRLPRGLRRQLGTAASYEENRAATQEILTWLRGHSTGNNRAVHTARPAPEREECENPMAATEPTMGTAHSGSTLDELLREDGTHEQVDTAARSEVLLRMLSLAHRGELVGGPCIDECPECGVLDCPSNDLTHYWNDGCTSCCRGPDTGPKACAEIERVGTRAHSLRLPLVVTHGCSHCGHYTVSLVDAQDLDVRIVLPCKDCGTRHEVSAEVRMQVVCRVRQEEARAEAPGPSQARSQR